MLVISGSDMKPLQCIGQLGGGEVMDQGMKTTQGPSNLSRLIAIANHIDRMGAVDVGEHPPGISFSNKQAGLRRTEP